MADCPRAAASCAGIDEVLRVEGLAYSYGKDAVWDDVSFALGAGQVAFLEGPNGAGKSTLLRCLAGWNAVERGEMLLCGERFRGTNRAQRAQIAFVPDVPAFYDDLTAAEHIRFMLSANHVPVEGSRAELLMEEFGLAAHAGHLPSSFSRGMRQKLALVLAFAIQPRLLLLDEPYGPLDRDSSVVLSRLIAEARECGAAALVSCHHDVPTLNPEVLFRLEDGSLRAVERG
ncbi:ABC transporter ATP-binding protein [Gordonibacter sp.]|uniref:ABC transporter ATP-binding protein n=1 Tax=Gordonibacter sp. TaxID=1968902 RepID=UPI002FCAA3BA